MQNFINTIIKKIVCPHPIHWSRLFSILQRNNQENIHIPAPLILGGWCSGIINKKYS